MWPEPALPSTYLCHSLFCCGYADVPAFIFSKSHPENVAEPCTKPKNRRYCLWKPGQAQILCKQCFMSTLSPVMSLCNSAQHAGSKNQIFRYAKKKKKIKNETLASTTCNKTKDTNLSFIMWSHFTFPVCILFKSVRQDNREWPNFPPLVKWQAVLTRMVYKNADMSENANQKDRCTIWSCHGSASEHAHLLGCNNVPLGKMYSSHSEGTQRLWNSPIDTTPHTGKTWIFEMVNILLFTCISIMQHFWSKYIKPDDHQKNKQHASFQAFNK